MTLPLTKLGRDVYAPTTAGGAPRGADMGDAAVHSTEIEKLIEALVAGAGGITLTDDVIYAINSGAGTANAVQATASNVVSTAAHSQLITINFMAANTGPMTISINGETPRPLVLNVGSPIPAGYVSKGGSALVQIDSAGNYRLFSYGDASAIQAAVEAVLALFNTQYLGAYASNPATDPAGGAIQDGAFYWNTTSKTHLYWDGDSWEAFPFATVADEAVTEQKLASSLTKLTPVAVATLADLKAISASRRGTVLLTEEGRAGFFVDREGDFTDAVAADTGQGVFVKQDDAAVTARVWARVDTTFLHPLLFGAEGQSDCTQAFLDCLAAADYLGKPMHILERALSYPIDGATNFAAAGRTILGVGHPIIESISISNVPILTLDVGATPGAYESGLTLKSLILKGNAATINGLYARGQVHADIEDIEVRNVRGAISPGVTPYSAAFNVLFGVAGVCKDLQYRPDTFGQTYKADAGIMLDSSGTGSYVAATTFVNPRMEGGINRGIWLKDASGQIFLGGTSEGNNVGVEIEGGCDGNQFTKLWCEANAVNDVIVRGQLNSFYGGRFQSATSGNTIEIPTGTATRFRDSYIRVVNLQSPSANTDFDGCIFSDNVALGIKGSGSYRLRNCVKTNTSGVITEVMTDV